MAKTKIEIEIESSNLLDQKSKEKNLKHLALLPPDVLEMLCKLSTDKGIESLRANWNFIQSMS